MATRVTAYRGEDGKLYESQSDAEKAELKAAVEHLASMEKSHVMNVVFGHSHCEATRKAIQLIANRLPPLCEPART